MDTPSCLKLVGGGVSGVVSSGLSSSPLPAYLVYSVPAWGVAFIRIVNAGLAVVRLLLLLALCISDVIMVLRQQLAERYSNAWEENRVATVHNRWLLLAPQAEQGGDGSDGDSDEDGGVGAPPLPEELNFGARRRLRRSAGACNGGGRGCAGGACCGGGGGPTCATTLWESLHLLPLRLLTAQAAALVCLVAAVLWGCGPLVNAINNANDSLISARTKLSVTCMGGMECQDYWPFLDFWVGGSVALFTKLQNAVIAGIIIGGVVAAVNVILAAPQFLADHRLAAAVRARGLMSLKKASAASLNGTAVGWERGREWGGAAASPGRRFNREDSGVGGSGRQNRAGADDAEYEEEALRLAAWRWALDLIPLRPGLTSLHGVPSLAAHSQSFAFDLVPTMCAAAVLSAALIAVPSAGLALALTLSQGSLSWTLAVAAVVVALLLVRAAGYTGLQLLMVTSDGRTLRFPRVFMFVDALSAISPLNMANGIAAASVHAVGALVNAVTKAGQLHRPALPDVVGDADPA